MQQIKNAKGCKKCFSGGNNKTHGDAGSRLYHRWFKIKERCHKKTSPNYKDYGGRGIHMCEEWKSSYPAFKKWAYSNGYEENTLLTVERVDNDKGYSPDNCVFASRYAQAHNRRDKHTSKQGFIGVNKNPNNNKWYSTVTHKGVRHGFGGFFSKEEARDARNTFILLNELPHQIN